MDRHIEARRVHGGVLRIGAPIVVVDGVIDE
jgi:hypothetical protein